MRVLAILSMTYEAGFPHALWCAFILDIFFAVSLYFSDVSEVQAFCLSQYLEKQVSAVLLTSRLT